MGTITLNYNYRSPVAKQWIEKLLKSGFFTVANTDEPNPETMEAIREARSGKPLPKVDTSSVDAMIKSVLG